MSTKPISRVSAPAPAAATSDIDRNRDRKQTKSLLPKGAATMSLARVQFFSVSLDGFGTGEGQTHDAPFGHAGERLHEWMFVTRWWHQMLGHPGGTGRVDDV